MEHPLSILARFAICMLFITLGTGCGSKRKIQTETNEVRFQVNEKRAVLKQSETESAALGNLGRYNYPQPQFFTELRGHVENLKQDGTKLAGEREFKSAAIKKMEDDLAAYQAKFPPR